MILARRSGASREDILRVALALAQDRGVQQQPSRGRARRPAFIPKALGALSKQRCERADSLLKLFG